MLHDQARDPIHLLLSAVLRGIRSVSLPLIDPTSAQDLRHLSRLVGRAANDGHDALALMPDYAACVAAAIPAEALPADVASALRPFQVPSSASDTPFDPGFPRPARAADLVGPVTAWIAAREAESFRDHATCERDIHAEVARVGAIFPRVGLTYGYLGTCSNVHDDRGFCVFTDVVYADGSAGSATRFGDHGVERLPALRTMALGRLEAWTRALDAGLDSGAMRLRSDRIAA